MFICLNYYKLNKINAYNCITIIKKLKVIVVLINKNTDKTSFLL